MLLADTSIWIDYIRQDDHLLSQLLNKDLILVHPFVVGELAVGNLRHRTSILESLEELPQAVVAEDDEVLRFVDRHKLFGLGIGYIDASLLASTRLTPGATFWTRDRRLLAVAKTLALDANPAH